MCRREALLVWFGFILFYRGRTKGEFLVSGDNLWEGGGDGNFLCCSLSYGWVVALVREVKVEMGLFSGGVEGYLSSSIFV